MNMKIICKEETAKETFKTEEEAREFAEKVNGKIHPHKTSIFFAKEDNLHWRKVFNSVEYKEWAKNKKIIEIKPNSDIYWKVGTGTWWWKKRYERLRIKEILEWYDVYYIDKYIVYYTKCIPVRRFLIRDTYRGYTFDESKWLYYEEDPEEWPTGKWITPEEWLELIRTHYSEWNTYKLIDNFEPKQKNKDTLEKLIEEYNKKKEELKEQLYNKEEEELKKINDYLSNNNITFLEWRYTFRRLSNWKWVWVLITKTQPEVKWYYTIEVIKETKDKKGNDLYIVKYLENIDKIVEQKRKLENDIKEIEKKIKSLDAEASKKIRALEREKTE